MLGSVLLLLLFALVGTLVLLGGTWKFRKSDFPKLEDDGVVVAMRGAKR